MTYERTCLDLFTGLGGFSLAVRANGVRTVAMCEIRCDCRNFLAEQWPGVTIHNNVKTLDATPYRGVWIVCGGPPCQPASLAGKQRGSADHRWLWPDTIRIVGECRPAWFLCENPPGLIGLGLDGVLAGLEAQGYETETLNIPACAVNAPHRRERLWIVGHTTSPGSHAGAFRGVRGGTESQRQRLLESERPTGGALADGVREQLAQRQSDQGNATGNQQPTLAGTAGLGLWDDATWIECGDGKRRRAKPGICGVVNGVSVGLLEALGNAIVWPIPARIIAAMIQAEEQ